jgi:hypothetical protein
LFNLWGFGNVCFFMSYTQILLLGWVTTGKIKGIGHRRKCKIERGSSLVHLAE